MHRLTCAAALLALAASFAACGEQRSSSPAVTVPPPALTDSQINEQDQVSTEHKRRESRAMDSRPLLDHLPLTIGDVRISIGGLASDDHTTVLLIDPGTRTDAQALAAYRDALHAYADSGDDYQPRIAR